MSSALPVASRAALLAAAAALAASCAGALLASGCSPAYVLKAWAGHARLARAKRPISKVMADPATPADIRARLALVEEVRRFAVETMTMRPGKSYSDYVEVRGGWVTVAVTACRKTAFEAYEWWFPVVGRVPYKGFFSRQDAGREAERLARRGYDTALTEVAAYSTLGWSADPVLSTMLAGPPSRLAELLLHELAHSAVYFKGQGDFNEAMATFMGEAGAEAFVRLRFGEGSAERRAMLDDRSRQAARAATVEALYQELASLYASSAGQEEKLARREEVFARFRPRLGLDDPEAPLNNAVVLAQRRYREGLEDFARAHELLGRDWPRTLALFRSLDRKAPREALRDWLRRPGR